MTNAVPKFIIRAFIAALFCYVTAIVLNNFYFRQASFLEVFISIPFIMLVTIGFHIILVNAIKSKPMLFINKYIAFSGIKLMIYMITILIYVFFVKFEIIIFLLSFIIIYFIFTITEVSSLLQIFKKN